MANLTNCKDCGHQISKNAASCPNCGAKVKKTSILTWIFAIFIGIPLLMAIMKGCNSTGGDTVNNGIAPQQTSELPQSNNTTSSSSKNNATSVVAEINSGLTLSQNNAVRQAKRYLEMQGFSRKGLIHQLSADAGDGFSVEDSTAAVDSLSVDWNEQAARSAKAYLDMQGFSCDGLIQQLSSSAGDRYTQSQAQYGAKQAGACN